MGIQGGRGKGDRIRGDRFSWETGGDVRIEEMEIRR